MTGGTVVVLGPTGRNFAAGMSGGRAYVWRLDTELVNRELVDLDDLDESDAKTLRTLVEAHLEETGSPVAERLLAGWDTAVGEFTAVVSREYKAALATAAAADEAEQELAVAHA
jgi:glutamate synthase (NADPH/NADH) large chain